MFWKAACFDQPAIGTTGLTIKPFEVLGIFLCLFIRGCVNSPCDLLLHYTLSSDWSILCGARQNSTYTHIYMHMFIRTFLHICKHIIYICLHVYKRIYIYTHIYLNICTSTNVHIHLHLYIHMHTYKYIYIQVYISTDRHIYTHTYLHIHILTKMQK